MNEDEFNERRERFEQEVVKYNMKYDCPDCAHFDTPRQKCSMGFPTNKEVVRNPQSPVVEEFCKYFEMD